MKRDLLLVFWYVTAWALTGGGVVATYHLIFAHHNASLIEIIFGAIIGVILGFIFEEVMGRRV